MLTVLRFNTLSMCNNNKYVFEISNPPINA